MIGQLGTHHHILNADIVAIAASTTGGDNDIGVELVNHTLGTQSRIHLANATFLHQHITVSKQRLELTQLLIHRYN